jgi:hypothetical protein
MNPREIDEKHLAWIKRRVAGETCSAIAADYGTSRWDVSDKTMAVLKADRLQSGEDVDGQYWNTKQASEKKAARAPTLAPEPWGVEV